MGCWRTLFLATGMGVLGFMSGTVKADDGGAQQAMPSIESWNTFTDGLRDLAPHMLARLPESMRTDPQIRQEVGRLMLEAIAATTIGAISADGDHPAFLPWLNVTLNIGQPNADTNYRMARITPGGSYRLRGERGSIRIANVSQFAPRPAEKNGQSGIYTVSDHSLNALQVDEHGRYDVIISPVKPEGYTGDWWQLDPTTVTLMVRMVSSDWANERDPTLSIERLDVPATRPRPSAADLEARLKALPEMAAQIGSLLVDHVVILQEEGHVNKMKVFDVSEIGGNLTSQFYYEGAYDLKDDEAVILEAKVPDLCHYYSVILTNDIYETTDWYHNHSSLNDAQLRVDQDGILRVVVSAKDPGVPNWLDTSGYPRGAIQGRWTDCSAQPIPTVRKVGVSEVRKSLPPDTPVVTPEQRDRIIRDRRAALQQRPLW